MTREEFESFLTENKTYTENNKTKSSDPELLNIYSYILKYQNTDSDWWDEDHGTDDLVWMMQHSKESIFQKIKDDIMNWSDFQTELLAQSLISSSYDFKINKRIKLFLDIFDLQKPNIDLHTIFYDRIHLNFKLADPELLSKLAEKLNYSSVGSLTKRA